MRIQIIREEAYDKYMGDIAKLLIVYTDKLVEWKAKGLDIAWDIEVKEPFLSERIAVDCCKSAYAFANTGELSVLSAPFNSFEEKAEKWAEEMAEILMILRTNDRLSWGEPFPWRIVKRLMLRVLEISPELSEKLMSVYHEPLMYISRNNVIINPAFFYPIAKRAMIPFRELEKTAEELVWSKCDTLPLEDYYECARRKIEFMFKLLDP